MPSTLDSTSDSALNPVQSTVTVQALLGLRRPPIAIGFFDSPPAGLPVWSGPPVAAGCVFWSKAQEGHRFYTVPADHYNCAVGAHTHGIALPVERATELEQTVGFMVENKYLALSEVPGIPTLSGPPGVVAYGPVDSAGFAPDVVVIAATPAQAMLIYEAAVQIGASDAVMNLLGRPGCAILPLVASGKTAAISLGCKGNRTFTGLPDNEMYLAIAGDRWESLVRQLLQVLSANQTLGNYYSERKQTFAG